jgi:hypothetical protein
MSASDNSEPAWRRSLFVAVVVLFSVGTIAWPCAALAAPAWSVQPAPSWVTPVDPAAPGDGPGAADVPNGVRYLLFDRQMRVGTTVETYTRWSKQITNEAGLASSSQVSIDFDPTYETLAFHSVVVRRGGETLNRLVPAAVRVVQREPNLEAQVFDGRQSAVLFLDDLRVGDIVESATTLRGADPTDQGHFTSGIFLGAPEPIAYLHARLVMTGGRRVRLRVHAPDGDRSPFGAEPVATREGTEYTWDRRDVRAFTAEPDSPSWYAASPWVQVTDFESWTEVAKWATRLFKVETPSRGSLYDWVKTARSASPSEDAFLLRAIRFVQDEIRYVGIETGVSRRRPTNPTTIFERRYGDCKDKATLLVTMLEIAGIAASPALVSTTQGHVLDERAPSPGLFDHAIVRIAAAKSKVYWVDATTALQGGGLERLKYSPFERALVVAENASGLETLTYEPTDQPTPSIRDRYTVAVPTSSTETVLESERLYEGGAADAMRGQLRGMTADQITKHFLATYQGDFSTIHEVAPLEQHDDRARNIVLLKLHFSIPRFWNFDARLGRYAVEVAPRVITATLSRPPSAKRTAPLSVPHPLRMVSRIDLDLPFDLPVTPAELTSGDDAFTLHFTSTYATRRLTYSYELATRAPVVAAGDVEAHLAEIEKMRLSLVRSLMYTVPPAEGFNWPAFAAMIGALPFVLFGVYCAYRYDPRRARLTPALAIDPRLAGISGWLVVLAIGIVSHPVFSAVGLVRSARVLLSLATWHSLTTPELATYSPGLVITVVVEVLFLEIIVAYGCAVALLFFRRRRTFPLHFTIFAIGVAAFALADLLVAGALLTAPGQAPKPEAAMVAFRSIAWAAIWVTYVHVSKRAAATFVTRARRRPRKRSDEAAPPVAELPRLDDAAELNQGGAP